MWCRHKALCELVHSKVCNWDTALVLFFSSKLHIKLLPPYIPCLSFPVSTLPLPLSPLWSSVFSSLDWAILPPCALSDAVKPGQDGENCCGAVYSSQGGRSGGVCGDREAVAALQNGSMLSFCAGDNPCYIYGWLARLGSTQITTWAWGVSSAWRSDLRNSHLRERVSHGTEGKN